MLAWPESNPKPIISRDGGNVPCRRPEKTGTKPPCVNCGRPTYRFIGSYPVCSYCTKLVKLDRFGQPIKEARQ